MSGSQGKQTAGAFDVRSVIAGLIGLYGLVLTVMGLLDRSTETLAKSAGINANLWSGIGMLAFAAAFALWARLRPVEVPQEVAERGGSVAVTDHPERPVRSDG